VSRRREALVPTTQPSAPEAPDRAFIEALVRLLRQFDDVESAPLTAAVERAAAKFLSESAAVEDTEAVDSAAADEMTRLQEETERGVRAAVDRLMIENLLAGSHRLLRPSDANRAACAYVRESGLRAADEGIAYLTLALPIARRIVGSISDSLALIDPDQYVAFWRQAAAIVDLALSRGTSLAEIINSADARASVISRYMTADGWETLTGQTVARISGLTPSAQLGGLAPLAEDDAEVQKLRDELATADVATEPLTQAIAIAVRSAMDQRRQEIWPES